MHRLVLTASAKGLFEKSLLLGLAAAFVSLSQPTAAATQWNLETFIRVPYNNTLFLARDKQDNLYATTFNTTANAAEVIAFRISNATGVQPKVTAFDRFLAPGGRGYAGVAVDEDGNIYLSADQGDGAPSFIKKFTPSLELDPNFGTKGILASTKVRLLGLAAYQRRIVAAVAWARLLEIDSAGNFLGMTGELPREQRAMIRDIAIIPSTQEVVGVERDGVYIFTGGSLDNLQGYVLRTLVRSPGTAQPQAGSAIYFSPQTDLIYYTINQGHRLGTVTRSGQQVNVLENVSASQGTIQPADAVLSSDAKTLFVSDLGSPNIARYHEGGVNAVVGQPKTAGKVLAASETASAPNALSPAQPATAASPGISAALNATPAPTPTSTPATGTGAPAAPPASLSPGALPPLPPAAPEASPPSFPMPPSVAPAATGALPPQAQPAASTAQPSGALPWESSWEEAFQKAATQGKKVAAFFYTPESSNAQRMEREFLADPTLASSYRDLLWVRVDISKRPEAMGKYGVFKVPSIVIFSADQKELKRVEGVATRESFDAAYRAAK